MKNYISLLSPARVMFILMLCFTGTAMTANAQANDMTLQQAMAGLSTAKSAGQVGERSNGYLGVVVDSANSRAIIELINDARRSEYTRIADQNSIAVADVEAMAGKRAIERTPAGQYIQLDGEWVVKR